MKTSVSEFPQFGLIGPMTAAEQEQDLAYRSYAETQDEIENYDLQGQEHDPYTIECEPDLEQEQAEYFRQEWIDPGSTSSLNEQRAQYNATIEEKEKVIIQSKNTYRSDFNLKAGWSGGLRPRPDTYRISGEVE
ncbi:MAG: hypothetical protein WBF33_35510 [Candidatus Nitrosopolaris sp.]